MQDVHQERQLLSPHADALHARRRPQECRHVRRVGQRHQEGCGAKGGEEASRGAIQDWQVSLVLHPSCLLSVVRRRKAIGENLDLDVW